LALFGFAVMSLRLDGSMTQGDWLTLISALGFSAQMLAVSHFVDKDNSILLTVVQMAFCGIAGLLIAIPIESPSLTDFQNALPILLYSTFIPTCIGYTGQVVGQRYVGSTMAALILSLEAVFAAIFGMLFLNEVMSAREILGSAIIFIAVILGQIEKKPPEGIEAEGSGEMIKDPKE
jgi:drug/metabolite transporter (DMT)-like permease